MDEVGVAMYFDETRYTNLNKDLDGLQFNQQQIEKENGFAEIFKKHAFGFEYPDTDIETKRKQTPLFFWSAPSLATKAIKNEQDSPEEIIKKLDQMYEILTESVNSDSYNKLVSRYIFFFFSFWPFLLLLIIFNFC